MIIDKNIEERVPSRNDLETIFMLKGEMITGTINVEREIGIGTYFNDVIDTKSFLAVYNVENQRVQKSTMLLRIDNIDWMSPNVESEPLRDSILPGDYNPLSVAVRMRKHTFQGDMNTGHHKRLSDRMNDNISRFIPLLNVHYLNFTRTIFINCQSIISVSEIDTKEK